MGGGIFVSLWLTSLLRPVFIPGNWIRHDVPARKLRHTVPSKR